MEMQGFDREKAAAFILERLDAREFKPLAAQKEGLVKQALDADLLYMREAKVLDENGWMGEGYYDDDDAFEFILEKMSRARGVREDDQGPLASFIDQYLELQQAFLEESGMLAWD